MRCTMDYNTPIIIPSKGRAGKTKTDKLLENLGLTYFFVVEPQEQKDYGSTGSNIMVLPENDQGLTYARDWTLRTMRKLKYERFWLLDDDILEFGIADQGKCKRSEKNILLMAYNQLKMFKEASIYSLELRQFSWCAPELQRNKMAMQCILFDLKNCENIDYDPRLKIRSDYDITLQAIFKGKGTLKSGKYYYNSEVMKSKKSGGQKYLYRDEIEMREVYKLCHKWPGMFTPVNKRERIDVKINWSKIK